MLATKHTLMWSTVYNGFDLSTLSPHRVSIFSCSRAINMFKPRNTLGCTHNPPEHGPWFRGDHLVRERINDHPRKREKKAVTCQRERERHG